MNVAACAEQRAPAGFDHHAVFYRGAEEFVGAVLPFVQEGVEGGEPVLAALHPERLAVLEQALGPDSTWVDFVDMAELGANPACIMPEWRRFLDDAGDEGPVRGVSEPVWCGRRQPELEEAALHEALLNVAFEDGPPWQLMCPYDVSALPEDVITDACRNHPRATGVGVEAGYAGVADARSRFSRPLPPVPPGADALPFGAGDLTGLRGVVGRLAHHAGVGVPATDDLVLAAHELATNSVVHGGGAGRVCAWTESGAFVVEIRDSGVIEDPLVGRDLLDDLAENGRGIWMANQLCDLVQVRSGSAGTAVRLFSWL